VGPFVFRNLTSLDLSKAVQVAISLFFTKSPSHKSTVGIRVALSGWYYTNRSTRSPNLSYAFSSQLVLSSLVHAPGYIGDLYLQINLMNILPFLSLLELGIVMLDALG